MCAAISMVVDHVEFGRDSLGMGYGSYVEQRRIVVSGWRGVG